MTEEQIRQIADILQAAAKPKRCLYCTGPHCPPNVCLTSLARRVTEIEEAMKKLCEMKIQFKPFIVGERGIEPFIPRSSDDLT